MSGSGATSSSSPRVGEASQQKPTGTGTGTTSASLPTATPEKPASQQDSSVGGGPPQLPGPLPFSKRARQIQEESGVNVPLASPVSPRNSVSGIHYRPPALRESSSFTIDALNEILRPSQASSANRHSISSGALPSSKGRDRAGTLPSSWTGLGEHMLPARPRDRVGSELPSVSRSGNSSPLLNLDPNENGGAAYSEDSTMRFGSISSANSAPSLGAFARRLTTGPSNLSQGQSPSQSPTQTPSHAASFQQADLPARLRTGSLASSLSNTDIFGPATSPSPSTGWPDRSRAQSTQFTGRQMKDLRGRGATIANPLSSAAADRTLAVSITPDILEQERLMGENMGLNDTAGADSDIYPTRAGGVNSAGSTVGPNRYSVSSGLSSTAGRDRATTMATATARPKVEGGARNRSSSFAPNQIFGNYSIDEESAVPNAVQRSEDAVSPLLTFAQHGGLANNALQARLAGEPGSGRQIGRGRAISLGMLDTLGASPTSLFRGEGAGLSHLQADLYGSEGQSASWMTTSPSSQNFAAEVVSQDDLYAYAKANGLDPVAFAEVAAAQGVIVAPSPKSGQSEEFGRPQTTTTRLRAGTVAVLGGGASSRMRAEQELMRRPGAGITASEDDSAYSQAYSSLYTSNNSPVKTVAVDNNNNSNGRGGSSPEITPSTNHQSTTSHLASTTLRSHNVQQPTRSLWIGNLDVTTTGQELMQAFAPYGAIESLRLLPEKECGFVNYVDVADAVRAREDVLQRLGGKIKPNGTGPGGTVRIGFGKIDSAPDSTGVANSTAAATSSPMSGKFRPISPSDGASLTPGGGERDESLPTRALWIGSIPSTTTPSTLLSIFQPYGPIESARVLTHKNCGFINFERVDDAVRARKMLNGRDVLGTEVGAVRVGFAKVPSKPNDESFPGDPSSEGYGSAIDSLDRLKGAGGVPAERQVTAGNLDNYRSALVTDLLSTKHAQQQNLADEHHLVNASPLLPGISALALSHNRSASHSGLSASNSIVPSSDKGGVPLPAELQPRPSVTDLQLLMEQLSTQDPIEDQEKHVAAVKQLRPPATYYTSIPLVSETNSPRRFDTTKLRDIRKGIESGQYSQADIDSIASTFLDTVVDLSSDYVGNTVVQKFFEKCSEPVKTAMLERIAPHLATIGVHKNGTWSAQKIIDVSQTPEQKTLIAQHLRPYVPPLLLDQFGNYVVQCLLPYGSFAESGEQRTGSDFIIDAMTDRCWEVAQGRFGARSMRACLESPKVTRLQCKRVAIAIVLNSVPLATSPNGSLLLTWLLEASELPGRFQLLAPRFTPHLTHLCTHKLASSTVLRLVNQSLEPEAANKITEALFESANDSTLEEILTDQVHGSQFITKLLQSTHIDAARKEVYSEQVRKLVREHRLTSVPAYRKLVEDLGLPFQPVTPHSAGHHHHSSSTSALRAGYPGTSPSANHSMISPHSIGVSMPGLAGGYPTSAGARYQNQQQQRPITSGPLLPSSAGAAMPSAQPLQQHYQQHTIPSQQHQQGHRQYPPHDGHFRDAFNPWPSMSSSPASAGTGAGGGGVGIVAAAAAAAGGGGGGGGYPHNSSPPPLRIGGRSPAHTPPTSHQQGGLYHHHQQHQHQHQHHQQHHHQQQQSQHLPNHNHSDSGRGGYVATTGY